MAESEEQSFARKSPGRVTVRPGSAAIAVTVLLLTCELAVRALEIRPAVFPSPSRVLLEILREAPQLTRHAWVTACESLEGLLLALLAGIPIASLAAVSIKTRRITDSVLGILRKLPVIAFAPLMVIWLGFGIVPAAAVSFLVCLLPIVAGLQAGFNSVPAGIVEILQVMGASPSRVFLKVHLPACLPFAASALRLSVPLAFGGATAAEFVGSDTGLGYLMLYASSNANTTRLFAALTVLILMTLCAYFIIFFIERAWISWPADPLPWSDFEQRAYSNGSSRDQRL